MYTIETLLSSAFDDRMPMLLVQAQLVRQPHFKIFNTLAIIGYQQMTNKVCISSCHLEGLA